jgi:hypothetical protein
MKDTGMDQWHCTDRDCAAPETCHLRRPSAAPRCACGSRMERSSASEIFTYLDFLRDEDYQAEEFAVRKE